jgi:hypothetical protein
MKLRLGARAALLFAAALALGPSLAVAESQQKDSDDYNCSHGSLDDPRTVQACSNLRGEPVSADQIAAARQMGFQRSNDDWLCHHARRGSHRQVEACRRLRGE